MCLTQTFDPGSPILTKCFTFRHPHLLIHDHRPSGQPIAAAAPQMPIPDTLLPDPGNESSTSNFEPFMNLTIAQTVLDAHRGDGHTPS